MRDFVSLFDILHQFRYCIVRSHAIKDKLSREKETKELKPSHCSILPPVIESASYADRFYGHPGLRYSHPGAPHIKPI